MQRGRELSQQTKHQANYFVAAAVVAAELHNSVRIAREIALASSNAGVIAQRTGNTAAGFGALAVFIDECASKTMKACAKINLQAIAISGAAAQRARTRSALNRFRQAKQKSADAAYLSTLDTAFRTIEQQYQTQSNDFAIKRRVLLSNLEDLERELQIAQVLASMSQVEASQASAEYKNALSSIAAQIGASAEKIATHLRYSISMFNKLKNIQD